jgi:hypothetical protein
VLSESAQPIIGCARGQPTANIGESAGQIPVATIRRVSFEHCEESFVQRSQALGIATNASLITLIVHEKQPGYPIGSNLQRITIRLWIGARSQYSIPETLTFLAQPIGKKSRRLCPDKCCLIDIASIGAYRTGKRVDDLCAIDPIHRRISFHVSRTIKVR